MAVHQPSDPYDREETLKQIQPCTRLFRTYNPDNYFNPIDPHSIFLYEPQPYYK